MSNYEWIDMLRLVPEAEHGKLVIVLQNGVELCVDTIVQFAESHLCLRGRVGGQVDEARGFFVPYDQMLCLRLDRMMKVEELQAFCGNAENSKTDELERPVLPPTGQTPALPTPTDAASASRLLLEKIRAVRASSAAKFPSSM